MAHKRNDPPRQALPAAPARRGRRNPVAAVHRRGPAGWTIAAAAVIVALIAGLAVYLVTADSNEAQPPDGVQTVTGLARDHVAGTVDYKQTPPVGGPHSSTPLTCGIYTSPVPNENAVHSLEHGAVWITYQPDLPAAQVSTLDAAAKGQPYVIVSPFAGDPTPVVASAWGVQLRLPSASDPRLAQFIAYYAQGPQTPEPGAPCTGVGNPQQP